MELNIPTPELDKMIKIKDQSQIIGQFLEYLQNETKIVLCQYDSGDQLVPIYNSIDKLLANYFKIDLNKVEEEKRALLNQLKKG